LLELSAGAWIEKRYDAVLLRKGEVKPFPPFEVELISPGRTFVPEIGKEVVIAEADRDKFENYRGPLNTALMDCGNLPFPLKMRNFRPGDRFHPLGAQGTQKLKEFFIDHKIPRFERPKIPLLVSGEMIVWVVGYRIDERVKVTEKTKKMLAVKVV
jgi:tRNA(Ile)-lysidine synthase